jgi:carbamoylphosphate synthase small subunit
MWENLLMFKGMNDIKLHVNNSNIAVVAPLDTRGLIIVIRSRGTHFITIQDVDLSTFTSIVVVVGLVPILH